MSDGNALGGGVQYGEDVTMANIVNALVDRLNANKSLSGMKGDITGVIVVPVSSNMRDDGYVETETSMLTFAAEGQTVPFVSFGRGVMDAYNRWYALVNGHRVNVLDAYVAGDIKYEEISGLIDEPLETTAAALGISQVSVNRQELLQAINAIRTRLRT